MQADGQHQTQELLLGVGNEYDVYSSVPTYEKHNQPTIILKRPLVTNSHTWPCLSCFA